MPIEHASMQIVRKPWGVADLRPWSSIDGSADPIGELWFQSAAAAGPALLLKLLFTSEPLSIQVHPDDEFAHSIGFPNGKTEAWYILSAVPGARVAVGLTRHLTPMELRASIRDGSIADLMQWRPVVKHDVIFVPAGTIHAIGAGIVLAEIQQCSDTTFRLFDHGRQRELHEDRAVAASAAGPSQIQRGPRRLTDARTVLIASPHFVLERVDLSAGSNWALEATRETWILVIEGHARIGSLSMSAGDAVFAENDGAGIEVGLDGMTALIAYPGPDPITPLLHSSAGHMAESADTSAHRSSKPKEIVKVQT